MTAIPPTDTRLRWLSSVLLACIVNAALGRVALAALDPASPASPAALAVACHPGEGWT
ncbi:MAG: hypothetical protein P4L83_00610 [Nevskia sp.]|nr:hypothetical protein [Nevskia sp.]